MYSGTRSIRVQARKRLACRSHGESRHHEESRVRRNTGACTEYGGVLSSVCFGYCGAKWG